MTSTAIEVTGLTKTYRVHERPPGLAAALRSVFRRTYRNVDAVKDLSFRVEPGERVGFLGPNGAGKTTTLKMLSGLLHPTSGEARVLGHIPAQRAPDLLQRITLVMGQKQQLLWDLPPSETFLLNQAVYGIDKSEYSQTLAELTELLDLGDLVKKPTRELSLGERMKCELCAALLHRPEVLFLDEPTIGLDVAMQLAVREFIRAYNERSGATVILTSHYMDDVAALCPRVVVIDRGALVYDGSLDALVRKVRPEKRVVLRLSAPLDRATRDKLAPPVEESDARLVLHVAAPDVRDVVALVLGTGNVVDLTVEDPPLEEVLRDLFASSKRGAASEGEA
ncbi:MAG: ATP-binding cassette domain-containing protein [Polyangiaceae bacterium]